MALGKTLGEISAMPYAELVEWQYFAQIEPWGSHIDDLRTGQVVAATYNVNRDTAKHRDAFGPLDFCPWNDMRRPIVVNDVIDPSAQSDALRRLLGFSR